MRATMVSRDSNTGPINMDRKHFLTLTSCVLLVASGPPFQADSNVESSLSRIKAVGRGGAGNIQASVAWKELVRLGPESLPAILAGFDGADATASNWLRAAVDTIASQA